MPGLEYDVAMHALAMAFRKVITGCPLEGEIEKIQPDDTDEIGKSNPAGRDGCHGSRPSR
jgi:hypothetical protein